ncbi:DUF4291 family protein [Saccharothrix syringae]|uniref:DUF4291 domain-containing protein n=1 Tax=Saccharothrix syringae TaxID=103733 RepID=A0A5Q0H9T7_SACSY|nr:DUF4291 family protein [Saccharothrix syringae]QFZ23008.1 DUF4291 domain-containing protein [Saccharothrix syringae]
MAYRCGYARKPGQERVLAIDITREGFHWALAHSALSHFDRDVHGDRATWAAAVKRAPVRVQWDPERDLRFGPPAHRAIQVGLGGDAVRRYVEEWITAITDVTDLMRTAGGLVSANRDDEALALLPVERPYPLPGDVAAALGQNPVSEATGAGGSR